MRRTTISIFAALWCLTAGATARAQYDSDLERPQVGGANPEGRPASMRPWAPLSYYVWHDGSGWHLRSTTSGHYHQFAGQVQAPEGVYNVRATDPSTPLNITGNVISFSFGIQGGERGFDWLGNGPMNFNLTIDGRDRSEKVRVGYGEQRPYPGGFQVFPGGAGPGPGGDEVVAATDEDLGDVQEANGPEMDVDQFQGALTPYGEWVAVPGYGTIWRPNGAIVGGDFQPYSGGHWAYTDLGWTWVSDYQWGWAPFHYGNWVYAEGGWGWIPGRVWAPAWVSWRYGGGYVGWAPCGPVGLSVTYVVQPRYYAFVGVNGFQGGGNIRGNLVWGDRAVVIHGQTSALAGASYVGGHAVVPVNAGPSPHVIGAASGHAVVPVQAASLHAVQPPAGQAGVHYAGGATASHPFATHPMSATVAKQYIAAQPKEAQQHFNESRQATHGGIQAGKPMATTIPAAHNTPSERQGVNSPKPPAERGEPATNNSRPQERSEPQQRAEPQEHAQPQERAEQQQHAEPQEHPQQQAKPQAQPPKPKPPPPEPKEAPKRKR